MRVYVAGPINGTGPTRNREAFDVVGNLVRDQLGAEPVIPHDVPPHEHGGPCPGWIRAEGETHNQGCHLRTDLRELLTCDGIALVHGWVNSHGARLELHVATAVGMRVWFQRVDGSLWAT